MALAILKCIPTSQEPIKFSLGDGALVQLPLHGLELLLHIRELLHLIIDALLFDDCFFLLGFDLALGPSAFGADLEEIDAAAVAL